MTDVASRNENSDKTRVGVPYRYGLPWAEEDFAGVMQACRSGGDLEEIARQIGRSPNSLRGQLRRLLPPDERHLPPDLVLARLGQLDQDGDYDWLEALSKKEKTSWELQLEVLAAEDERGIGALSDDDLISLAVTALNSTIPLNPDLRELVSRHLRQRQLAERLNRQVQETAEVGVGAVLRGEAPHRSGWWYPQSPGPGYEDDSRYWDNAGHIDDSGYIEDPGYIEGPYYPGVAFQ